MNVLYLTELTQISPVSGIEGNLLNVLRRLARNGHRVCLVAYVCDQALEHISLLKEVCAEVYAIPQAVFRGWDLHSWLRSLASGQPFLIEWTNQAGMRKLIQGLLDSQPFDVIHTDKISMVQFALMTYRADQSEPITATRNGLIPSTGPAQRPALLYNSHDDPGSIQKRISAEVTPILRPFLSHEIRRVQQYEQEVSRLCDHSIAAGETELDHVYESIANNGMQQQMVSFV